MATITHRTGSGILDAFGSKVFVANDIRNELNHRRPKLGVPDVVMTEPVDGSKPVPYMPRPFPKGIWVVTAIVEHSDPDDHYLNPFFIATDAFQMVEEWSLTAKGFYDKPTGRMVKDGGYGIHWPDPAFSTTTLGCLRVINRDDLVILVRKIREAHSKKEVVRLVVS